MLFARGSGGVRRQGVSCPAICAVPALQAISVTEELLLGDVPDEDLLPSSSAAAQPADRPAKQGPKIVLTQAPTIQLSSVLPATVRLQNCSELASSMKQCSQEHALREHAPPYTARNYIFLTTAAAQIKLTRNFSAMHCMDFQTCRTQQNKEKALAFCKADI